MKTVALILTALITFAACSDEKVKPKINEAISAEEIPTQESWDSEIIFTKEGELQAILNAEHLQKFEDKNKTFLEGVKIDFYDNDTVTSQLTSEEGVVDNMTNNMSAIGNVVAANDSGDTLYTEELTWKNKEEKIVTDKFVTIISQEEKTQGYGFEADQDLSNYVIYNITYVTSLKEENK